MLVLGVLTALALAVYTTFLGTEGEVYRFLRRYGVVVYFGSGFLAQLLFLRIAKRERKLTTGIGAAMLGICVAMLALGLGNVIASLVLRDAVLKDHLENALEWQLGLLLVAWFVLQAVAWKRARFAMVLR